MTDPTAQQLAERGIRESHDHAEGVDRGWTARAVAKIAAYSLLHPEFLTEEAKAWSYEDGLVPPPDDSAWGHVMRAAQRQGIIHRYGERPATSPGSHGKLMAVWRRGPKPENMVSRQEALDQADQLDRWADAMRKEGRSLFAEALRGSAQMMRNLVNV